MFLYIIESGLKDRGVGFTRGTFGFLQVCKWWNEVAVGFPQLWVWWASGAFKAWELFNARSKGAPIFLTWGFWCTQALARNDVLEDPTIPGRIRTLDFGGTNDQMEDLLSAFGSSRSSNASSIRLHVTPHDGRGPRKHTTAFLSLSFPKLSKLDISNSLPSSSSRIFTTSNLVSLRLKSFYSDESRYSRSQFSKILQCHPNLQELHLWQGGMPWIKPSEALIPVVLPGLVDLQLYGTEAVIAGFADLLSTSSPLHGVIIDFKSDFTTTVLALANAVERILTLYYGRQGLDYPHMADHLTISSDSGQRSLRFNTMSRSTSASHPTSNLELQFGGADDMLVEKICLLFPLDRVVGFTAIGLSLLRDRYHEIFKKMEALLHLRLDKMDPGPVMDALGFCDRIEGVHDETVETLSNYLHTHSRGTQVSHPQPPIVGAQ